VGLLLGALQAGNIDPLQLWRHAAISSK